MKSNVSMQLSPVHQPPAITLTTLPAYEAEVMQLLDFLATAHLNWPSTGDSLRGKTLSTGDTIACISWQGSYFISGTDILKVILFRFAALGRSIPQMKKFEEGVFSDLRSLKLGRDAVLEEPRSKFLEFLHTHGCVRTQKKQKIFYWQAVDHERLFQEAVNRELRKSRASFFNAGVQSPLKANQRPKVRTSMGSRWMSYPAAQPGLIPNSSGYAKPNYGGMMGASMIDAPSQMMPFPTVQPSVPQFLRQAPSPKSLSHSPVSSDGAAAPLTASSTLSPIRLPTPTGSESSSHGRRTPFDKILNAEPTAVNEWPQDAASDPAAKGLRVNIAHPYFYQQALSPLRSPFFSAMRRNSTSAFLPVQPMTPIRMSLPNIHQVETMHLKTDTSPIRTVDTSLFPSLPTLQSRPQGQSFTPF